MATQILCLSLLTTIVIQVFFSPFVHSQTTPVLDYTLTEEHPPSQYLGNLLVQTGLNFSIPPEYQKETKFSLNTNSQEYEDYFTIEDGTGMLI